MDPASAIIRKLGGASTVQGVTGVSVSAPYRWQRPKAEGGTNGLIPQRHHPSLLDYARRRRIRLRPEEFLPPRSNGKRRHR